MATLPVRPKIASGPSRHVYDVLVLGGQLGGAIAAALLAKRGYRVLLVEHDGMGQGYEHEGYVLPYAPFVSPAVKALTVFDEVLAELGLHTAVQRALRPHQPDLQLIFQDARVDLHPDETRRVTELTREFGADVAARVNTAYKTATQQYQGSDAFFKESPNLPPEGIIESFTLKRLIAKHPSLNEAPALVGDDRPTKLLGSLLPFVSYLNAPGEPLGQTRAVSHALGSPNRYPGGREGLRELICHKLSDLGGEIIGHNPHEPAVVEELSFDGGKLVGLKILRSDIIYRGAYVIASTDAGALRRLVPDKKKQRALSEELELVTTKQFLFAVNWVIPQDALPEGMGDLLLVETLDPELQTMMVQVQSARRIGSKPNEDEFEKVVTAGIFVPASVRDLGEDELRALSERISAQLEALMPFAKEKRLLVSAPYLDAGGVRGSRLLPHPLCAMNTDIYLGVSGLPQRTSVKNLFLASREILPGLGLEGEVLAGVRAARMVQEAMKKTDPLKR